MKFSLIFLGCTLVSGLSVQPKSGTESKSSLPSKDSVDRETSKLTDNKLNLAVKETGSVSINRLTESTVGKRRRGDFDRDTDIVDDNFDDGELLDVNDNVVPNRGRTDKSLTDSKKKSDTETDGSKILTDSGKPSSIANKFLNFFDKKQEPSESENKGKKQELTESDEKKQESLEEKIKKQETLENENKKQETPESENKKQETPESEKNKKQETPESEKNKKLETPESDKNKSKIIESPVDKPDPADPNVKPPSLEEPYSDRETVKEAEIIGKLFQGREKMITEVFNTVKQKVNSFPLGGLYISAASKFFKSQVSTRYASDFFAALNKVNPTAASALMDISLQLAFL